MFKNAFVIMILCKLGTEEHLITIRTSYHRRGDVISDSNTPRPSPAGGEPGKGVCLCHRCSACAKVLVATERRETAIKGIQILQENAELVSHTEDGSHLAWLTWMMHAVTLSARKGVCNLQRTDCLDTSQCQHQREERSTRLHRHSQLLLCDKHHGENGTGS